MLRASWMIVVAIAFAWVLAGMSRTNARSIFRVDTGISVSRLSDEWPVPKSSIASFTPLRCRSCRIAWVRSGSTMALDSLTSTTICPRLQAAGPDRPQQAVGRVAAPARDRDVDGCLDPHLARDPWARDAADFVQHPLGHGGDEVGA